MTHNLVIFFLFAAAVLAQNFTAPCRLADCGPYTPTFCEECNACLPASLRARADDEVVLSEAEKAPDNLALSQLEYTRLKNLQLDYLVEFAKNPVSDHPVVDLPYCGLYGYAEEDPAESDGDETNSTISSNLQKRFNLGRIKFSWPRFKRRPKRPVFKSKKTGTVKPLYPACVPQEIKNIKVFFHIFASNSSNSELITPEIIKSQVDLVNSYYNRLGIQFNLYSTRRHYGTEKFRQFTQHGYDNSLLSGEEDFQKEVFTKYRSSRYDELNIFVVEQIRKVCTDTGYTFGYCTYPQSKKNRDVAMDRCVIIFDSIPGVQFRGSHDSNGITLVHEIGHWLGLKHTFAQGATAESPCDGQQDNIEDTIDFPGYPPSYQFQSYQSACCGKKPCENTTLIRVTNIMSYSQDSGAVGNILAGEIPFTRQQRASMFANFFTFRRPYKTSGNIEECSDRPIYPESPGNKKIKRDEAVEDKKATDGDTNDDEDDDDDDDSTVAEYDYNIFNLPRGLMHTLSLACSIPFSEDDVEIEWKTGKIISAPADMNTSCSSNFQYSQCPPSLDEVVDEESDGLVTTTKTVSSSDTATISETNTNVPSVTTNAFTLETTTILSTLTLVSKSSSAASSSLSSSTSTSQGNFGLKLAPNAFIQFASFVFSLFAYIL
ncbi:hypothetical protein V1514DRAFT_226225 [Lipomyces japonicus]|uniref:uncharacterized protein n=1 Tax=Lipomyces japonicus TaxID=56871 RepID=UPI0034CE3704